MEEMNRDCSKRKLSPCVAGVLGASLVANLFLAGLAMVPLMKIHGGCHGAGMHDMMSGPPPGITFMIKRLERELSTADAAAIQDIAGKAESDLENAATDRDAAFAALGVALKASTVDGAAVQKALSDVSVAHSKTEAAMSAFIQEAAPKLSVEGRTILADKGLPPAHTRHGEPVHGDAMHDESGHDMPPPSSPPPLEGSEKPAP